MKKGLFRAALMLCMLFVLAGTALAAEHTDHPVCVNAATCTNPNHTDEDHSGSINWKGVSSLRDIEQGGYYYLLNDVTISSPWSAPDGAVLCLNGHDITLSSSSYYVCIQIHQTTFTLTDCGTNTRYGYWNSGKTTYTRTTNKSEAGTDYDTLTGGCVINKSMYSGSTSIGVNVYGTFNMYGGTITGNTGCGVRMSNDGSANCFNMYGGAITGNYAWYGGVYVQNGTFTMTGGEITDNNSSKTYNAGGVCVYSGTFQVSGTAKITGNTLSDGTTNNVCLPSGKNITITGKLESSASIGVTRQGGAGTFTSGWSTDNSTTPTSVFFSDSSTYAVTKDGNELALKAHNFNDKGVSTATGYHKHSVGDTETIFTPWTSDKSLPTAEGSYVLTNDVTLDATWEVQADITLDLNGYDIKLESGKTGSVIQVNSGKTFTLYDCGKAERYGYWNGGSYKIVANKSDDGTTYDTITGGIITGGNNRDSDKGGGITVEGTFHMYGGNIAGNAAYVYGGGVYLDGWKKFNMYGGAIVGNKTTAYTGKGGGVCMYGQYSNLTIFGGEITNNRTDETGGGVYIYGANTNFTMSGGKIKNNTAGSDGGGVFVNNATFTMTGGEISGNTANGGGNAGGVSTNSGATFTMSGGEISGNTATGSNGVGGVLVRNIFNLSGTAKITGNTKVSGESTTASNVYLKNDKKITIKSTLDSSASIGVAMQQGTGTFTSGNASSCKSCFTSDNTSYHVATGDGELKLEVHALTYQSAASGTQIKESCSICSHTATATISAPTALTYDGIAKVATVTYSTNWAGGTLTPGYSDGGNVNVGSVTATITKSEVSASVTYSITEAASSVTQAPAANSLTYSGSPQALVTAGTPSGGTMKYSTDNSSWSDTIPTRTDAGTYTVYYKVVGDANHNDTASQSVSVTIGEKSISGATVALGTALTYNGEEQTQTVSSVTIDSLSATYSVSNDTKTNADTYTLTVTGTGNFTGSTTANFTIGKKTLTPSVTGTLTKAYDGGTSATGASITLEGIVNNDNVSATATFAYDSADVASATKITATNITLSGTASDNYKLSVTTAEANATITNASQAVPAAGEGYIIDYTEETITVKDGYEVSTTKDFTDGTAVTSGSTITPGTTYYVRLAAKTNYNASPATAFSVPRPAKPTGLTVTDETIQGKKDGTISGVTEAMEYKLSNAKDWTPITGTELTGLAPGSYDIRYAATSSTLVSEAATVTVAEGVVLPTVATSYSVQISSPKNGTVQASTTKAAAGATVTLTVTPDEGYELGTLTVTDSTGKALTLTQTGAYTYTFVMPAGTISIQGTFVETADEEEPDEEEPVFTDVDQDAYYAEAVAWAVANEITKGTSETTFSPDEDCTRAQVVTFLWRYAGKPEPTITENPFTDVEEGTDYYKAILWAYENGITIGTSDTTFSPEETCTRAQVVTFLWRYEGELTYEAAETFADVAENAYYHKAVAWAAHEWITKGTGDGKFSPDENCSRGQVVTFLYRDTAEG
jgi:hypothetical protein